MQFCSLAEGLDFISIIRTPQFSAPLFLGTCLCLLPATPPPTAFSHVWVDQYSRPPSDHGQLSPFSGTCHLFWWFSPNGHQPPSPSSFSSGSCSGLDAHRAAPELRAAGHAAAVHRSAAGADGGGPVLGGGRPGLSSCAVSRLLSDSFWRDFPCSRKT